MAVDGGEEKEEERVERVERVDAEGDADADGGKADMDSSDDSSDMKLFEDGKPDVLYDPDDDEAMEQWVKENLVQRSRRSKSRTTSARERRNGGAVARRETSGSQRARRTLEETSSAAKRKEEEEEEEEEEVVNDGEFQLTCPCCFTLLCVQCQQHVKYHHQFRAIFVMNCTINDDEKLRVRVAEDTGEGQARGRRRTPRQERELYQPVACSSCGTNVGVLDSDEVYHFCNVMY